MKKNNLIYLMMFFLSFKVSALTCSSQNTQLLYINGIWVKNESDASKSADKILNTLKPSLSAIDSSKNNKIEIFPTYNVSTGYLTDLEELENQAAMIFNKKDRVTYYKEILVQKVLNHKRSKILKDYQEQKVLEKINEAFDLVENKGLATLPKTRSELEESNNLLISILEQIASVDVQAYGLSLVALADIDVTELVKKTISKYISQGKKIIYVAHSQGNVVLKKAVTELSENHQGYMTNDEFEKFKVVFGSLHVANPTNFFATPILSGGVRRSEYITLNVDDAINLDRENIDKNYAPDVANYIFDDIKIPYSTEMTFQKYTESQLNDIPLIRRPFRAKYTNLYHGMDDVYLNYEVLAHSVIDNKQKPMSQIFTENVIKVAEKLGSSCESPIIKISVNESFNQDPNTGVYKLSGYSGSERFVSVTADDLTKATGEPDTEFTWSISPTYSLPTQNTFSGKMVDLPIETNLKNITVVVKAVNSFGISNSKSFDLKVDADRPIVGQVVSQTCLVNPSGYTSSFNRITFNYSDPDIVNDSHTFIEDRQETDPTAWFNISSPYAVSNPQSFSFQSACVPRFDLSLVEGPKCLNGKWIVKVSVDTTYISGLYADFNSSYISHYEGNPGMDGPITEEVSLGDGSPKFGESSPVTAKIWIAANENVYKEISVSLPNVCR